MLDNSLQFEMNWMEMRRFSNTALWKGFGVPIIAHVLAQKKKQPQKGVIVPYALK